MLKILGSSRVRGSSSATKIGAGNWNALHYATIVRTLAESLALKSPMLVIQSPEYCLRILRPEDFNQYNSQNYDAALTRLEKFACEICAKWHILIKLFMRTSDLKAAFEVEHWLSGVRKYRSLYSFA